MENGIWNLGSAIWFAESVQVRSPMQPFPFNILGDSSLSWINKELSNLTPIPGNSDLRSRNNSWGEIFTEPLIKALLGNVG